MHGTQAYTPCGNVAAGAGCSSQLAAPPALPRVTDGSHPLTYRTKPLQAWHRSPAAAAPVLLLPQPSFRQERRWDHEPQILTLTILLGP
jgi:hypothetical protein